MDIVLKPILEKYGKFSIEKQRSPSYVQIYTKHTRDIVFAYNEIKSTVSSANVDSNGKKSEVDNLELTGSPLKLDLSLHTILDETLMSDEPQLWKKEEAGHAPISIEIAREITNLYHKNRNELSSEDAIPLWILTNPSACNKPLLLMSLSNREHFGRGIVTYEEAVPLEDVDLDQFVDDYAKMEGLTRDSISTLIDCQYVISGVSYSSHSSEELLSAPHGGVTCLHCEWAGTLLQTPFISCKVHLEQEAIIGHLASPCNAIWKSVTAFYNINQILVDITAAGIGVVDLNAALIRNTPAGSKRPNTSKMLKHLLNETEALAYTAESTEGGCICITDDTTTLHQCLTHMNRHGSSNDFVYKLWDVLRESETASELISLLVQALKFISSGKIRPFIIANNKTHLSKLVIKLSRGHSQTAKVIKNLVASPAQALSLVAQVAVEKTMWEYTRVMSLLEHSFFVAGIWNTDNRSQESVEQINQTIQDMTMSGGDFVLNPFESLSNSENSIRLDYESFYDDDPNELTVDDFASLKKHGLVNEKKDVNEIPLIADEIDISPWKNVLMKFAQVHSCLEHLYRAETCLRADFASLKPISSRLLEYYISDKSPVRTVGQLLTDPVHRVNVPVANGIVQDHLKKLAFWYRVEMTRKENAKEKGVRRDSRIVYVFSQQSVFPPAVWQHLEPQTEEVAEITSIGELKYHCTKYTYISNKQTNKLPF